MAGAMADDVDVDIGLVIDGDSLDVGLAGGGAAGASGASGISGAGPIDSGRDGQGANLMLRRRPNRVVKRFPLELQKAIRDVQFIQNHMKRADEYDEVIDLFLLYFFPSLLLFDFLF